MNLHGKKIILGVSGSIAAYKAVVLLRLLQQAGAEVRVVLSPTVERFVGKLTFSALTQAPVFDGLWDAQWSEHVSLGNWADLMLIAPATANTLAKLAQGHCDNALTAVYLAAACPVMLAPAMDSDMYQHPAVQANLARLRSYGHQLLPTETGYLASGLEGPGRLLEPAAIVEAVVDFFSENKPLRGQKLLISAGPTREPLDPVRFLTNRSTGKMGYALAREAVAQGAEVCLVTGPVSLSPPPGLHELVAVETAAQMAEAILSRAPAQDVIIMAAAVADYAPAEVAAHKLKKHAGELSLPLTRTTDILHRLGQEKPQGQVLVGFAMETQDELANAQKKLAAKRLDFIVLNSLTQPGAGFAHDTNQVTLIHREGEVEALPLQAKTEVATAILQRIQQRLSPDQ
jgi:phosphopantothenoylcysteine decarboxylase / phosphopantothenate---cysteine ligase